MTIGAGLLSYNLILLSISLFFRSTLRSWDKKIHLMQIIKGQVPVRGIISLILIGQLLAIIIVTLGIGSSLKVFPSLATASDWTRGLEPGKATDYPINQP